ncbi:MAG: class I SAM-dependent methyltransferase [Lachnospiraceae bacterium]|nr:class I SAM-dependent methyltransferase [Lachnospiraceae bacterium]
MELSKRMEMLLALVPRHVCIADIGCDHGFVSMELVRRNICDHVIAADLREGPLSQARAHVEEAGLSARISLRISDGLSAIAQGEADGFLTAGMGGRLIRRIIEQDLAKVRAMQFMVLQPQSEIEQLRAFLRAQRFEIVCEEMVREDGKFYPAMLVRIGHMTQSGCAPADPGTASQSGSAQNIEMDPLPEETEDRFGPCLIRQHHPVLLEYLSWWEEKQQQILEALEKANGRQQERIDEVTHELLLIRTARALMDEETSL